MTTPRTDAHQQSMESEDFDVELAKIYTFARQLETELNESRDVIKQCHSCISLFLGWHSRDLGMDHLRYVSETLAKCANQLNHSAPATSQETT